MKVIDRKGIVLFSVVPIRREPKEASEMVTQLLFGETFTVLEENGEWFRICIDHDNYCGWVNRLLVKLLPDSIADSFFQENKEVVESLHAQIICKENGIKKHLLRGSYLPCFESAEQKFYILEEQFEYQGDVLSKEQITVSKIIDYAKEMLGIPYLWGGRTLYGIDCSGFTQLLARMKGIKIPRDASQQFGIGRVVKSLEEAKQGDLVFFCNDINKITHVGLLLSDNSVIHASGQVRIDRIDERGIFNAEMDKYTHKLCGIKQIFF